MNIPLEGSLLLIPAVSGITHALQFRADSKVISFTTIKRKPLVTFDSVEKIF